MVRSHVTKVTAVLLLTLALGAVSVPAQAAGGSPERSSRWEQLAELFFDWLLKTTACIDPNGGASLCSQGGGAKTSSVSLEDSSMIDPNGKAGTAPSPGTAALCLDYCGMIDPNGSH